MPETDWLKTFLPLLQCPASGLPLRPATDAEKQARQISPHTEALVSSDGVHWYPVEQGIPVLLPPEEGKKA
jgi:uncharacterized protein YbaR (Trm112 family)